MSLGERITALRKEVGLTQADLSRLMEVSRQAVSKWEQDKTEPDTLNLIRLADILSTDVEYLATGKHIQMPKPEIITVTKPIVQTVEKPIVVEKIIKEPVIVEKRIEIEKRVDHFIEKPVPRKVYRTRYIRNPMEYAAVAVLCLFLGIVIGLFL